MIFRLFIILTSIILLGSRCSSIEYKDDYTFLNAAQANKSEWPGLVNNKICKDMDGNVGACVKRIRSNDTITIRHNPRPYAYELIIKSTDGAFDYKANIEKDSVFNYEITPEEYEKFRAFTLKIGILPMDREKRIAATWRVTFVVVDELYKKREEIYYKKDHFIVGQYAKYSEICGKQYKKHTVIKADKKCKAFSESEVMRFNYYGY